MTIQAVVAWAQAQIKATSAAKIQYAPNYPTDTSLTVPSSIALADNLRFSGAGTGGNKITLFDLHIDILIPRNVLEDALQWFNGVPKAVADIFRNDPTMGGNCQTFGGDDMKPVLAQLASDTRDGISVIGYIFTIPDVKLHE